MSTNKSPLRVGVSGLGRSGYHIHVKAMASMVETFKVAAVFDPLADRAQAVAAETGARCHGSFEDLCKDPALDVIVVASPNRFHAPQAISALKAGKHVLCEKPFGLVTADVDAMMAAAKTSGKVLQPFQQRRFEPEFKKAFAIAESGLLGRIVHVRITWHGFKRRWDWQTDPGRGGGTLNNNGPHLIDHGLEFFGPGPVKVWAQMGRYLCSGEGEDHMKVILSGESRPTVELELSDTMAYAQDKFTISGTAGALRGGANGLEWKWVDWSKMPARPLDLASTPDRSYNSETLPWQEEKWAPATAAGGGAGATPAQQPTFDLYQTLYAAAAEGKPQAITPLEVRRRTEVLEQIRAAAGWPLKPNTAF